MSYHQTIQVFKDGLVLKVGFMYLPEKVTVHAVGCNKHPEICIREILMQTLGDAGEILEVEMSQRLNNALVENEIRPECVKYMNAVLSNDFLKKAQCEE